MGNNMNFVLAVPATRKSAWVSIYLSEAIFDLFKIFRFVVSLPVDVTMLVLIFDMVFPVDSSDEIRAIIIFIYAVRRSKLFYSYKLLV